MYFMWPIRLYEQENPWAANAGRRTAQLNSIDFNMESKSNNEAATNSNVRQTEKSGKSKSKKDKGHHTTAES